MTSADWQTGRDQTARLMRVALSTGARRGGEGLVHDSDRDSQHVGLTDHDALVTAGVTASVSTVGDSNDNALTETVNALYTTEPIRSKRVWKSTQTAELATMGWCTGGTRPASTSPLPTAHPRRSKQRTPTTKT